MAKKAQARSSERGYNAVARGLHWVMAFIIIGLLAVGFGMGRLPYNDFKFEVYTWHKSFGMIVLWLATARVAWRFISSGADEVEGHAVWERFLAKTIQGVFYSSQTISVTIRESIR